MSEDRGRRRFELPPISGKESHYERHEFSRSLRDAAPRKDSYGYEPGKWTHPALEVPGLWAGHESRVVVPPATVARVSSPFFVLDS